MTRRPQTPVAKMLRMARAINQALQEHRSLLMNTTDSTVLPGMVLAAQLSCEAIQQALWTLQAIEKEVG